MNSTLFNYLFYKPRTKISGPKLSSPRRSYQGKAAMSYQMVNGRLVTTGLRKISETQLKRD